MSNTDDLAIKKYTDIYKPDGLVTFKAARELYDAGSLFGYWDMHPDCSSMDSEITKAFANNYARYKYQEEGEVDDRTEIWMAWDELNRAVKNGRYKMFSSAEEFIPADKLLEAVRCGISDTLEKTGILSEDISR